MRIFKNFNPWRVIILSSIEIKETGTKTLLLNMEIRGL